MFRCLILIIIFCPCLLACPYKEIFKYNNKLIVENGIEVLPLTFFYKEWKKKGNCNAILRIHNGTDKIQRFNFQHSYLTNLPDTSIILNVYFKMGEKIDPRTELIMPPKTDTVIGLAFVEKSDFFKEDIYLLLSSSAIADVRLLYKKR